MAQVHPMTDAERDGGLRGLASVLDADLMYMRVYGGFDPLASTWDHRVAMLARDNPTVAAVVHHMRAGALPYREAMTRMVELLVAENARLFKMALDAMNTRGAPVVVMPLNGAK
jgi:hypothetical protein